MTDDQREALREALIFEYRQENAYVLGLSDEELQSLYEEYKHFKVTVS